MSNVVQLYQGANVGQQVQVETRDSFGNPHVTHGLVVARIANPPKYRVSLASGHYTYLRPHEVVLVP